MLGERMTNAGPRRIPDERVEESTGASAALGFG
jgi:hypothetical protein